MHFHIQQEKTNKSLDIADYIKKHNLRPGFKYITSEVSNLTLGHKERSVYILSMLFI